MKASIEEYANVARSVKDANDLDSFGDRAVKDDVITNWITSELRSQVRSPSTEFWHSCQHFTLLADFIEPAVRSRRICFGNSKRDFDEVQVCPAGSQDDGHQAPFLFKRLRTFSLMSEIFSGARSPRLACSIPAAISRRSSSWRRRCTSFDAPSQRYSSQRCLVERRFVADLTSVTVLMGKNYRSNECISIEKQANESRKSRNLINWQSANRNRK
jgi:hypothetical protein